MINALTRNDFLEFKREYSVFSTVLETDSYLNEHRVKSAEKTKINTMFHPLTSSADIEEYGERVHSMLYCILYDVTDIDYYDIITVDNIDYEIVSIKKYNTHTRIDIEKRVL